MYVDMCCKVMCKLPHGTADLHLVLTAEIHKQEKLIKSSKWQKKHLLSLVCAKPSGNTAQTLQCLGYHRDTLTHPSFIWYFFCPSWTARHIWHTFYNASFQVIHMKTQIHDISVKVTKRRYLSLSYFIFNCSKVFMKTTFLVSMQLKVC